MYDIKVLIILIINFCNRATQNVFKAKINTVIQVALTLAISILFYRRYHKNIIDHIT